MSPAEYRADAVIHVIGLVAAGVGAIALLVICAARRDLAALAAVAVYALGLITMLSCSAAYNLTRHPRRKALLRRFDHAGIFLMIAGTYTPLTTQHLTGWWAIAMTSAVWAIAVAGIVLKLVWPGRLDGLSTGIYLALGWIIVVALKPLVASMPVEGFVLLGLGGAFYTLGVIFHLWERLPFQNAIWHGFVLAAAAIHYTAIIDTVVLA